MYYNDNQKYPLRCQAGALPIGPWVFSTEAQPWIPELTSDYIKTLPVDPKNIMTFQGPVPPTTYVYQYQSLNIGTQDTRGDGTCSDQYFTIGAHLENSNDPQINMNFPGDYWGGWFVNYVVGNP